MPNNLFPVFNVPSTLAENIKQSKRYRPAPLFDIEKGEFVLDGARRPIYGSGYDAWVLWCIKTVLTERWSRYAYSSNAGIETERAFHAPDRKAAESALVRTITEAFLADPRGRTRQVRDFQFQWNAESLYVTCVVVGHDGNSATIKAPLRI